MKSTRKVFDVAKTGDVVVIYGTHRDDRDVIKYTDAKELVAYIRERDHPAGNNGISTNEDYMRFVVSSIQKHYTDFVFPCHTEDAFVEALFRLGMVAKTTLN